MSDSRAQAVAERREARDWSAAVVQRAAEFPRNPLLEVYDTGRRLHASLDAGARWLIVDFGERPPPLAHVPMAMTLRRIDRRATAVGGALVVVAPGAETAATLRGTIAGSQLDVVESQTLAQERVCELQADRALPEPEAV